MKKFSKLILSLTTLVCATATFGYLASSCSEKPKPKPQPGEVTVKNAKMNDVTHARLELDWTPNEHNLEFSWFSFKYNSDTEYGNVTQENDFAHSRPQILKIIFDKQINNDIIDGKLSFHCKDNTAGIEFDKTIEQIELIPPTVIMSENSDGITLTNNKWISPEQDYTNILIKPDKSKNEDYIIINSIKWHNSETGKDIEVPFGEKGYTFNNQTNSITIHKEAQINGKTTITAYLVNLTGGSRILNGKVGSGGLDVDKSGKDCAWKLLHGEEEIESEMQIIEASDQEFYSGSGISNDKTKEHYHTVWWTDVCEEPKEITFKIRATFNNTQWIDSFKISLIITGN